MGKTEKRLSALQRAIAQAIGNGRELGNVDDPARQAWPELWTWLSTVHVGQDQVKNPATLSIRLGVEGVIVSLVDRDLSSSVEANCACLADSFQALENALAGPNVPLRTWGKREPHLRKRRSHG